MVGRMFLLVLAFLIATTNALASDDQSSALEVRTDRIIVFKDGYCMFIKQATGRTDARGKAFMQEVPDAMVLGSFWAIPRSGKLKLVTARQQIIPRQARQETEKTLVFEFESQAANKDIDLTLTYFGPGIRWIPTYRIALLDNGNAHMLMQAEILNEAEDLTNVKADLIVGVPNFRFKNVVSPMSLEASLRNTLQQAAPQIMGQSMSNVLFSQRIGEVRGQPEPAGPTDHAGVPALPEELAGEGVHDLFRYSIPDLDLRSGERSMLPLISAKVPFRHIYTWDVKLSRSGTEAVPGRGAHSSPVKLLRNEVWHQVELKNETAMPWTTGAALVVEDYLPIAQELLTYTSSGSLCQLPLTVAVDVRGTYAEEETGRELKAIRFDGNDYTRISKKGTLQVTNYKNEHITLLITCEFGGNATRASDDGNIVVSDFMREDWQDFRGSHALTGHTTVRWQLILGPAETREVTCEYFYYAR